MRWLKWVNAALAAASLVGCPSAQVRVDGLGPQMRERRRVSLNALKFKVDLGTGRNATLNADLWKPDGSFSNTVVIMVPGSGAISRKGLQEGDGVVHYESPLEITPLWAEVFAQAGHATLAYDKRNCTPAHDSNCDSNPIFDLDQEGPKALRRDVDAACRLARQELGSSVRIVLWSDSQSTQVVLASECKNSAAALVMVAPITDRIDRFWVQGLMQASKLTSDGTARGALSHRARSLEATFASINKGLFEPGSKIMGVSLQFWKEWIAQTKGALAELARVNKPTLFLLGSEDFLYPAGALKQLKSLKKPGQKTLVILAGADHHLLIQRQIAPGTADQVRGALASLLKRD